ncbi:MAG: MBL fold metallo-hydrolase [Gammaproteobacteria bacterium]|nr:MBL fold metallo-hydrolase [Gammaproteobacteria bacterium]
MCVVYEYDTRPEFGQTQPVADGIDWLRMPLPFMLGHINLWLLDDGDGFAIVDTGVFVDDCRDVWTTLLDTSRSNQALTRVIVTHLHPDHAGCAGWLARENDVELWMTRSEYLLCRILVADTGRQAPQAGLRFYRAAGFSEDAIERYQNRFGMFGKYVAALPESYRRMQDSDRVAIGDADWEVIVGRGHSPEHACLFNASSNIVISGDQLLPTISSNVSVHPTEPMANPLHDWLDSLQIMKDRLPDDVLVLPAHGKPFRGAHARLDALIEEHRQGLDKLHTLCAEPRRAVDTFEALFKSRISDGNLIMATGEAIAHLNYLTATGELERSTDGDDVHWYRQS